MLLMCRHIISLQSLPPAVDSPEADPDPHRRSAFSIGFTDLRGESRCFENKWDVGRCKQRGEMCRDKNSHWSWRATVFFLVPDGRANLWKSRGVLLFSKRDKTRREKNSLTWARLPCTRQSLLMNWRTMTWMPWWLTSQQNPHHKIPPLRGGTAASQKIQLPRLGDLRQQPPFHEHQTLLTHPEERRRG